MGVTRVQRTSLTSVSPASTRHTTGGVFSSRIGKLIATGRKAESAKSSESGSKGSLAWFSYEMLVCRRRSHNAEMDGDLISWSDGVSSGSGPRRLSNQRVADCFVLPFREGGRACRREQQGWAMGCMRAPGLLCRSGR